MTDARRIWEAADYDGLIEGLRCRVVELGVTHAVLDELTGLQTGYIGKLLGPVQAKKLGPLSLNLLLQVLAVKIVLVEDPEGVAAMSARWEQRVRPDYNAERSASVGKTTIKRMFPVIAREMGKRSGAARMLKMKPETRRRVARQAAKARWQKRRLKRTPSRAQDTSPAVLPASQAPANPRPQCVGTGAATSQGPAPSVGRPA